MLRKKLVVRRSGGAAAAEFSVMASGLRLRDGLC